MVPLDVGVGVAPEAHRVDSRRGAQVGDVEERQLGALRHPVGVGVLTDAEQEPLADRVQVGGVAGDLQLTREPRLGRVAEVDGVERIDLAEGHQVADVVEEPHRVDLLVGPEATELTGPDELVAALGEDGDEALALARLAARLPRRDRGARDAQKAVALRHRPLAQHPAGDAAAGHVLGRPRLRSYRRRGSGC